MSSESPIFSHMPEETALSGLDEGSAAAVGEPARSRTAALLTSQAGDVIGINNPISQLAFVRSRISQRQRQTAWLKHGE